MLQQMGTINLHREKERKHTSRAPEKEERNETFYFSQTFSRFHTTDLYETWSLYVEILYEQLYS